MNGGYLTLLIDRAPSLAALTGVLRHQQRLLERLLFRMSELALLLAAGEHRFVARAVDETADIERHLGEAEMVRALVVAGLAERWGIPERDMTLETVILRSPEGPARRLSELRDGMRELVDEIERLRQDGGYLADMRSELADRSLAAQRS